MMKVVCLLSGGMDPSTLAYLARSEGYDIFALHLNYGQRTKRKNWRMQKRLHVCFPPRTLSRSISTIFQSSGRAASRT